MIEQHHSYVRFQRDTPLIERVIDPGSEEWPEQMNELGSEIPPTRLYATGRTIESGTSIIAIVGTRRPTLAGIEVAERLSKGLAEAGWLVVSGLAMGIDAAAHRACLEAGGATIAIVGCGLDVNYPRRNETLRKQIESRGTVMSEHANGIPPLQHHFPARNRIIAGLSMGVVVVEGGFKSGALITARMALDANRSVFAVPGSTRNPMAEGPNDLIKRSQAAVVTNVQDIFDELANGLAWSEPHDPMVKRVQELTDIELSVLTILDDVPVAPDRASMSLRLPAGEVLLALSRLEIRGLVLRRHGSYLISDSGARIRSAALA